MRLTYDQATAIPSHIRLHMGMQLSIKLYSPDANKHSSGSDVELCGEPELHPILMGHMRSKPTLVNEADLNGKCTAQKVDSELQIRPAPSTVGIPL